MAQDAEPLPEDVKQLQSLVRAQRVQIEYMRVLIAKLRRMQFGRLYPLPGVDL
jgi:hypothetical protein